MNALADLETVRSRAASRDLFEGVEPIFDPERIGRAERVAAIDNVKSFSAQPLRKKFTRSRDTEMIAFDLETDRIPLERDYENNTLEWTPTPKYITAYGEDGEFTLSEKIEVGPDGDALQSLCNVLVQRLFTRGMRGRRFVAWAGNKFDAYLIGKALLRSRDYILSPYLTGSKSLRGIRVVGVGRLDGCEWEVCDGMAMTGLDTVSMPLSRFVSLFAPQYPKLKLDFSKEEFDGNNPDHVAYAERDSEALYYAMIEVERRLKELTGNGLRATLGNSGIRYFQAMMPPDAVCFRPNKQLSDILHTHVKRGGYCWIQRPFKGKVWKYDLNQAYAAAMRDAKLPSGRVVLSSTEKSEGRQNNSGIYRVQMHRTELSAIPFYYRDIATGAGRFTIGERVECWLTSSEIDHLKSDNWNVEILNGYVWENTFNMSDMVNHLEKLRFSDPEGPSGPLGIIVKTIGNSAYGKTLEQLWGQKLVMASECPEGYNAYAPDNEALTNVFSKEEPAQYRSYHCPQIGCFITAHVRILVRNAALASPSNFVYADTDCVVFDKPVSHLEIDARRYGAWKLETEGVDYTFIGKKIYKGDDGSKHAKGLHIKKLTDFDFEQWAAGRSPKQRQLQRRNFIKVMLGKEMFGALTREGTNVSRSSQAKLVDGRFLPL